MRTPPLIVESTLTGGTDNLFSVEQSAREQVAPHRCGVAYSGLVGGVDACDRRRNLWGLRLSQQVELNILERFEECGEGAHLGHGETTDDDETSARA